MEFNITVSVDKQQCVQCKKLKKGCYQTQNIELTNAIKIISENLKTDSEYYYAWQANIAVAFQDVLFKAGYQFPELHKLSNEASKRFIDTLIQERKQ